jgi:Rrf2 family protein
MFSKSCEYAIRASIIICQHSQLGKKINIKELSEIAEVPESYLAKVMQIIARKGIVNSTKGPGGGFFFNGQMTVRLLDIVIAIDGNDMFSQCGLGLKECSEKNPCAMHEQFKVLRTDLKQMLSKTTLKELSDSVPLGKLNKFILDN